MPEDTNKYRKRFEDDSSTELAREETARIIPSGGLSFDRSEDFSVIGPCSLTPIADQVLPPDNGEEATLGDAGLSLLLAEHASGRVRELLQKAETLTAGKQWRAALVVIDTALATDESSGEAWALKGACLSQLGLHEAALRVLHHARGQVTDPEVRMRVLKLEAECAHTCTAALESQLMQLAQKGRLEDALKLVGDGLRRQPSNIVLLYHQAKLLLLCNDNTAARLTVDEARRHMGRDSADLIAELERTLDFGPHLQTVEAAREALRRHDSATSLQLLNACASALEGNEQFEGLRAYAESKRRTLGQLLGARKPPHSVQSQQQTLRWLLTEELRQADAAARAGDHARTRAVLSEAAGIEPNCGAALFRHARAIVAANRAQPTLDDLKEAEALALHSAAVDPDYRDLADGLVKAIHELCIRSG